MVQKCENERGENMVGKNTIVEQERYIKEDNGCMHGLHERYGCG